MHKKDRTIFDDLGDVIGVLLLVFMTLIHSCGLGGI